MNIMVYLFFASLSLGPTTFFRQLYVVEIPLILNILLFPLFFRQHASNNRIISLDIFVIVFALYNMISVMVGSDSFYESAKFYRYMVLTPVLIYILVRYVPVSTDVLRKGLYFLVGGTLVQSPFFIKSYWVYGGRANNVEGAIATGITASVLFCIGFCTLFYMRGFLESKASKGLAIVGAALLAVALIVNATRAVTVGTVVLLPFGSKIWGNLKYRRLFTVSAQGLLLLFIGVILLKGPSATFRSDVHVENYREIRSGVERLFTPKLYLKDLEGRLAFWSKLARQALERPLLGSGSASYVVGGKGGTGFRLGSSHNMFISSLITSGIPGLILLFMLIGGTYHCLNKTVGKSDAVTCLGTVLLVTYSILILVCLTNDLTGGRSFIFFFLMALAARLSLLEDGIPKSNKFVTTKPMVMESP